MIFFFVILFLEYCDFWEYLGSDKSIQCKQRSLCLPSVCLLCLGCTPLILSATGGHASTVQMLLDQGADIEAQSDRTKDTALSLACSGGRQEVGFMI